MVAPLNISLPSIGFLPNLQVLDHIDQSFHRITVRAQPISASVSCTGCGTPSRRVHGAYWRSLGDVACFGRLTVLLIRVRRSRCSNATCRRRTFAEPLPGVACPQARQTDRRRAVHRTIGQALGGNPGSRHARAMGVPISRTTLVHRVRVGTDVAAAPVTVLGVDDWACRKGHR